MMQITTELLRRLGYDLEKNPPAYWYPSVALTTGQGRPGCVVDPRLLAEHVANDRT